MAEQGVCPSEEEMAAERLAPLTREAIEAFWLKAGDVSTNELNWTLFGFLTDLGYDPEDVAQCAWDLATELRAMANLILRSADLSPLH